MTIEEQVKSLADQLERNEISKEEFQRRVNELIENATGSSSLSALDTTRLDQVYSAARIAKEL